MSSRSTSYSDVSGGSVGSVRSFRTGDSLTTPFIGGRRQQTSGSEASLIPLIPVKPALVSRWPKSVGTAIAMTYFLFTLTFVVLGLMIEICPRAGTSTASLYAFVGVLLTNSWESCLESELVILAAVLTTAVNAQSSQMYTNFGLNAIVSIVCNLFIVIHWTLYIRHEPRKGSTDDPTGWGVYSAYARYAAVFCIGLIDGIGYRNDWVCHYAFALAASVLASMPSGQRRWRVPLSIAAKIAFAALSFSLSSYDFSLPRHFAFVLLFPVVVVASIAEFVVDYWLACV